jgi:hypothetical protein
LVVRRIDFYNNKRIDLQQRFSDAGPILGNATSKPQNLFDIYLTNTEHNCREKMRGHERLFPPLPTPRHRRFTTSGRRFHVGSMSVPCRFYVGSLSLSVAFLSLSHSFFAHYFTTNPNHRRHLCPTNPNPPAPKLFLKAFRQNPAGPAPNDWPAPARPAPLARSAAPDSSSSFPTAK